MGEWLFKEEEYTPKEDKDAFINKSIISFLSILSQIKKTDNIKRDKGIYNISPVLKLGFTVVLLVFMSLTRSAFYILILDIYVFMIVLMLNKEEMKKVLAISFIIPIFTFIMLTPSILLGNINNSLIIVIKTLNAVLLINVLSYSTKWSDITKALKLFHVPDIFVLTMEITLRYIFLLGEFSLNMLYALKLRSVGKNNRKHTSVSHIIGTIFLKSKDMGEEMYSAMECRGFTGEYKAYKNLKFKRKDYIYIIVNIILINLYFILEK